MLKGILSKFLDELQEKLLDDFRKDQIRLSFSKGDIKLHEVSIKQELTQNIHPLLSIDRVVLYNVSIKFSVAKLRHEPIVVEVGGLFVLLSPKLNTKLTPDDILKFAEFQNDYKLRIALILQGIYEELFALLDKYKSSKFVRHYLNGILKNIKIKVSNILVRYEDADSAFCLQCMVKNAIVDTIEVKAVDGRAVEVSTSVKDDITRFTKKASFYDVTVWLENSFTSFCKEKNKAKIVQQMREIIKKPHDNALFGPISFKIVLDIDLTEPSQYFQGPLVRTKILIDDIRLSLSAAQFSCILTQLQLLVAKINIKERIYKPKEQLGKAWWSYLLTDADNSPAHNQLMYSPYIYLFARYYIARQLAKKKDEEEGSDQFYLFLGEHEYRTISLLHHEFTLYDICLCRFVVINELRNSYLRALNKQQFKLYLTSDEIQTKIKGILQGFDVLGDYPVSFIICYANLLVNAITVKFCSADYQQVDSTSGRYQELFKLNVHLTQASIALKSNKRFILQTRVQSLELAESLSGGNSLVMRTTQYAVDKISKLLQHELNIEYQVPFISFGVERSTNAHYDIKLHGAIQSLFVYSRPEIFLIAQQIKMDIMRLRDYYKNHQFVVDLARNLLFTQKQKKYKYTSPNVSGNKHVIIYSDIGVSSPIIAIPDRDAPGKFFMAHLGALSFKSNVVGQKYYVYQITASDEYKLSITQICVFRVESVEQYCYLVKNLDYVKYPEFTDIAKKQFLLLPFTMTSNMNYVQFADLKYSYGLTCQLSEIGVNINNNSMLTFSKTVEAIVDALEKLHLPFWRKITYPRASPQKIEDVVKKLLEPLRTEDFIRIPGMLKTFIARYKAYDISASPYFSFEIETIGVTVDITYLDDVNSFNKLLSAYVGGGKLGVELSGSDVSLDLHVKELRVMDTTADQAILGFYHVAGCNSVFSAKAKLAIAGKQNCDLPLVDLAFDVGKVEFYYSPRVFQLLEKLEKHIFVVVKPLVRIYTKLKAQTIAEYRPGIDASKLVEIVLDGCKKPYEMRNAYKSNYCAVNMYFAGVECILDGKSDGIATLTVSTLALDLYFSYGHVAANLLFDGFAIQDDFSVTQHHNVCYFENSSTPASVSLQFVLPYASDFTGVLLAVSTNSDRYLHIVFMKRFVQTLLYYMYQQYTLADYFFGRFKIKKAPKTAYLPDLLYLGKVFGLFSFNSRLKGVMLRVPLNDNSQNALKITTGCFEIICHAKSDGLYSHAFSLHGLSIIGDRDYNLIDNVMVAANLELKNVLQEHFVNVGISMQFDTPFVMDSHDCRFVYRLMHASNNLGYNIVDDIFQNDEEVNELVQQVQKCYGYKDLADGKSNYDISVELDRIRYYNYCPDCDHIAQRLKIRIATQQDKKPSLAQQLLNNGITFQLVVGPFSFDLLDYEIKPAFRFSSEGVYVDAATTGETLVFDCKIRQFSVHDASYPQINVENTYLLRSENIIYVRAEYRNQYFDVALRSAANIIYLQYVQQTLLFLFYAVKCDICAADKEILYLREQCLQRQAKVKKLRQIIKTGKMREIELQSPYLDQSYVQHVYYYEFVKSLQAAQSNQHAFYISYQLYFPVISISIPENSYTVNCSRLQISFYIGVNGSYVVKQIQKFGNQGHIQRYFRRQQHEMRFVLTGCQIALFAVNKSMAQPILDSFELAVLVKYNQQYIFVHVSQDFISEYRNLSADITMLNGVALNVSYRDIEFVLYLINSFRNSLQTIVTSYVESTLSREPSVLSSRDTSGINIDYPSSYLYMAKSLTGELENDNLLRDEAKVIKYRKLFRQEFPVYLNDNAIDINVSSDNIIRLQLFEGFNNGAPVIRFTVQKLELEIKCNGISYANAADLTAKGVFAVGMQTYNYNTQHWESLLSDSWIDALCTKLPRDEAGDVASGSQTSIEISIARMNFNFSPIIQRQVLKVAYLLGLFSQEREESCFYNPYNDDNLYACVNDNMEVGAAIIIKNCCRFNIYYEYATILPYQSFNVFEDRPLVELSVSGPQSSYKIGAVLCQDDHLQIFQMDGINVVVYVTYQNRSLQILFRERYYFRNCSRYALRFGQQQQYLEYFTSDPRIEIALGQERASFAFNEMPFSIKIGKLYFRVAHTFVTYLKYQYYEIQIWPTYVVSNECVQPIKIDEKVIAPFGRIEAYVDPADDFVLSNIEYTGYKAEAFTLCKVIPKTKKNYDENENQDVYYDFAGYLNLSSGENTYILGTRRICSVRAGWRNAFNHQVSIYPYYILRHNFGFVDQSIKAQLIIKQSDDSKAKFRYICDSGMFTQLGIVQLQSIDAFLVLLGETPKTYILAQNVNLGRVISTIRSSGTPDKTLAAYLCFGWAKNHLTRTITLLPSRIVRNNSGFGVTLYFGAVPLHSRNRSLELGASKCTKIVPFSDSHVYLEYYRQISCAFDLAGCDCYLLVLKNNPVKFAIQTTEYKQIQLIDIFDAESASLVQIINHTNYTLQVRQCFDLSAIVKSKAPPQPSIDTFDIDAKLIPQFQTGYFDFADVSLPPVLNIRISNQSFSIAVSKIGKRKPQQFDGFTVFVQVDIRHEKRIVFVSTRPIMQDTLLQKAQRKFELEHVLMRFNLRINHLSLSYYTIERREIDDYFRNVPVEAFRLLAVGMQTNVFKLLETTACNLQISDLSVFNVQPRCDYQLLLGFERQNGIPVVSVYAEKLNNAFQFSGVYASFASIELNIDESTLQPVLKAFYDIYNAEMRSFAVDCDKAHISAFVSRYLLPALPYFPERKLDLSALFVAVLYVSTVHLTLNVCISGVGQLFEEFPAASFLSILAGTFSNVQNARLVLYGYSQRNFVGSRVALVQRVVDFYKNEFRRNIMQLLRSAGIFGGVGDTGWRIQASAERMFDAEGLDRLQGIAMIGQSIVAGYGGAVSTAAQTLQSVAGAFAFDSEYAATERRRVRDSHRGVRNALVNSALTAGNGIIGAVVGVVAQPVIGAREGFLGAMLGIARGMAGLVAKPVAGLAGAVGHLGVAVSVAAAPESEKEELEQRIWRSGSIGK